MRRWAFWCSRCFRRWELFLALGLTPVNEACPFCGHDDVIGRLGS